MFRDTYRMNGRLVGTTFVVIFCYLKITLIGLNRERLNSSATATVFSRLSGYLGIRKESFYTSKLSGFYRGLDILDSTTPFKYFNYRIYIVRVSGFSITIRHL